jgi:hypothetical protein
MPEHGARTAGEVVPRSHHKHKLPKVPERGNTAENETHLREVH